MIGSSFSSNLAQYVPPCKAYVFILISLKGYSLYTFRLSICKKSRKLTLTSYALIIIIFTIINEHKRKYNKRMSKCS